MKKAKKKRRTDSFQLTIRVRMSSNLKLCLFVSNRARALSFENQTSQWNTQCSSHLRPLSDPTLSILNSCMRKTSDRGTL